ncbi:PEP-CTERM sorting domain-containing protein [Rivularia sp. UHCC 0363]|uniref:PEP-CTERM sorting domain-containing protein n=1 Tax=Rivularia sp. UHCC 0363 TaxID=3110244 RepID=UPI002B21A6BA|nr:PEP-CTERM sorting domain-containing protein [Rivularia sp. UHCC 0363]MEA5598015.1 PEP-CTERM sorting domain-containing protein [Rivularia sp. UHCC 0363]
MITSQIRWLIPVALASFSIGSNIQRAAANTTFPFNTVYDTEVTVTPIDNSDVVKASVSGTNSNAPYGLTNFMSENYSRIDPGTGVGTFSADPTDLGLDPAVFPLLTDEFFGSGDDKLFGFSKITALFDFQTFKVSGEGSINITGGAGRFTGASGSLAFTENGNFDPNPTAPILGEAIISGSFQVPHQIPEPTTTVGLITGALGASLFLRQKRRKTTLKR